MVNSSKIRGRIVELGLTQKDLAEELNLAVATVSQKINNVRPMSLAEAYTIARILEISDEDFREYFFKNDIA